MSYLVAVVRVNLSSFLQEKIGNIGMTIKRSSIQWRELKQEIKFFVAFSWFLFPLVKVFLSDLILQRQNR